MTHCCFFWLSSMFLFITEFVMFKYLKFCISSPRLNYSRSSQATHSQASKQVLMRCNTHNVTFLLAFSQPSCPPCAVSTVLGISNTSNKLFLDLTLCITLWFLLSTLFLSAHPHHILSSVFSFSFSPLHRSLTSNLPNVNLPNVNLQMPKVPNLPVSVSLPPVQMPSFSTPNWMPALSDTECVLSLYWVLIHAGVALV